jgi:hypothetical protein
VNDTWQALHFPPHLESVAVFTRRFLHTFEERFERSAIGVLGGLPGLEFGLDLG